ncbi:phage major capsid protein [Sansalvadorimonas verongulae]|uniref:phage major capsid protein n=1 Tax=Sansalvadorimonas verongulae TaxID=2172824 RepID=UPI0012BBF8C1|nr:phage major capsid protein [Sansalvadorimonas verongulae]MTI12638.1 phage major capsid protein [Sansalvadorimonas verongulae]
MTIAELMRRRAEVQAEIQSIADREAALPEGESLSAEDIETFNTLETQFNDLEAQIDRQHRAQKAKAAAAKPVSNHPGHAAANLAPEVKLQAGDKFARMAMCVAQAGGNPQAAAKIAESQFGDTDMSAALDTQTPNAAGVLVHEDYSSDFIELLTPLTVVRRMGARQIPMPNGNLTMNRKTGRGNAGYGSEGSDIVATKPTFGNLKFSAKKLTALTPISNDLIRQASQGAVRLVREDLTESVALAEDSAFLRSDGSGDSPTGLRHQIAAGNIIDASTISNTPDLAKVEEVLSGMVLKLRLADIGMTDCGWIMSPTVYTFLERLRDGNGNKVYPEMAQMRLKSYKIEFTNQIPENLGAGGDESEIYFADFSQVLIPDTMQIRLDVSTEATYKDGSELVSAFSRDQTVVRVIAEHDFGMRHDKAAAVATGIKWGIS